MRAGRLRFRVQIQRFSGTQDSYGQVVGSWTTIATVWADCQQSDRLRASGREFTTADQIVGEQVTRFICRWPFSSWSPDQQIRIVFRDAYYDVISATNENMRDRELIFVCRRGANNG